ncbi:MAG: flagellar hook-associated protein FlgK [Nisaea sp.]|nr:flagellar hook-associated protein FlgK [Nisaea sp.]OUY01423.1 MAG: flagellar hook-associated protein FlgK [Candidatus Endolissoclinum sp. TMED26]|tara:strand:- start:87 stop:1808 length:1722 start_codon:yes stop_codon:yes gene_type:complete
MSLLSAFSSARAGIVSAQSGIDLAARNVANASTEGYSRKIQQQSSLVAGGEFGMLRQEPATRLIDTDLQKDLRTQVSTVEELKAVEDFLGRMELSFGPLQSSQSIASKITALGSAFESLSVTPNLETTQKEVILAAQAVADEFNRMSAEVQDLRLAADSHIHDAVNNVNLRLENILHLNAQITKMNSKSSGSSELDDQRDLQIDYISKEMNIKTFTRDNGQLAVMTGNNDFMLDRQVYPLDFQSASAAVSDSTMSNVLLDDGLPGSQSSIGGDITSGRIAGLLKVRDELLPQMQDQLDALAYNLARKMGSLTIGSSTAALNLFHNKNALTPALPAAPAGFSAAITVNQDIIDNPALLREGDGTGTFQAGGDADPSLPLAALATFNEVFTLTDSSHNLNLEGSISVGDQVTLTVDGNSYTVTATDGTAATLLNDLKTTIAGLTGVDSVNIVGNGINFRFSDTTSHSVSASVAGTVTATASEVVVDHGLTATASFESFAAEMISFQGNQRADYENRLSFQGQLQSTLSERFDDMSKVNIDEEISHLVELQSAFTASARVLTSVQRVLDELLEIIR